MKRKPVSNKGSNYKPAGKEKYPTILHEDEYEALKIVIKMAEGNMHCRQTDERRNAVKLIKNIIK